MSIDFQMFFVPTVDRANRFFQTVHDVMGRINWARHLRGGIPLVTVTAVCGWFLHHVVDGRISVKKQSRVIDSIGFQIDQDRNLARTRSTDEDPIVTEQLKKIRKAAKAAEKANLDGSNDYELKPVPKPSSWYN